MTYILRRSITDLPLRHHPLIFQELRLVITQASNPTDPPTIECEMWASYQSTAKLPFLSIPKGFFFFFFTCQDVHCLQVRVSTHQEAMNDSSNSGHEQRALWWWEQSSPPYRSPHTNDQLSSLQKIPSITFHGCVVRSISSSSPKPNTWIGRSTETLSAQRTVRHGSWRWSLGKSSFIAWMLDET